MSEYRTAAVFVRNRFAGMLKETDFGYSFQYDHAYLDCEDASPVSLTLPMQEAEFTSKTLFSFFDGLIPEGWLLSLVTRNWKLNAKDRFGILLVACKDPIGNVTIQEAKR
jgi:serine/threonine-protein kinase HipA